MKTKTAKTAVVSTAVLFLTAVASGNRPAMGCEECQLRKAGTYLGQFTILGNGTVRTWVKIGENGKPTSVGVTFSETALSGLAKTPPKGMIGMEYNLTLPKEAAVTGFDYIGLDWNPQGHEPPGIYDTPHFDFHFYLVPKDEVHKMTFGGAPNVKGTRKPAAKFLPTGYIMPPGTEVPRMGAHAIDGNAPELHGQPFTHTFLYGYYNGKVHFIEPMITKAFLETKSDITVPLKQPAAYPKRGYYPTHYSIKYDSVRQEYTVALEGLTRQQATEAAPVPTKIAAAKIAAAKSSAVKSSGAKSSAVKIAAKGK